LAGKKWGAELLVELVEHFLDAQLLGLADGGGEGLPELAQNLVPVDLAAGNIVELVPSRWAVKPYST
jgi:hypothetical protein